MSSHLLKSSVRRVGSITSRSKYTCNPNIATPDSKSNKPKNNPIDSQDISARLKELSAYKPLGNKVGRFNKGNIEKRIEKQVIVNTVKQKKNNQSQNSGMSFNLSVITHPSSDISKPSLILEDHSTGNRTIIGNVPAGLQRKCNEMHLRTSRLTNIFFSGILTWESLSGLPGLILTVSDQGVKSLDIYHSGNRVIQFMISCWRYFIFRFGMDLKAKDTDELVQQNRVNYKPINIKPLNDYGNNENKEDDHEKLDAMMDGIFPLQTDPSRPIYNYKKISNLTLPKSIINPKISTNWIITPESIRGKFLVKNAKELGCEVHHFKDLCNFKSVTTNDGTIITPEQVLEPTRHFNPILVLDIPSNEYLSNTLSFDWMEDTPNNLPYVAVFHFIDDSINDPLSNPEYIKFIQSFGPATTHFISHISYCPNSLNFFKTLKISIKWKSLLSNFFPLPKWSNDSTLKIDGANLPNVLPLISGQSLIIKSTVGTSLEESSKLGSDVSKFTPNDCKTIYDDEIKPSSLINKISQDDFNKLIDEKNIDTLRKEVDLSIGLKDQVETLVLGTGSAIPSNIRNVLCNIVRIPYIDKNGKTGFRSIVLDAGENSFGSLKRLYNPDEVNMILDEIKMIYLSHLHADHHLGIIDFIREWNQRQVSKFGSDKRVEKLFIITPWQYDNFMGELNQIDPFIDRRFISHVSCDEFMVGYTAPSIEQCEIENISVSEIGSTESKEIKYIKDSNRSNYVYQSLGMDKIISCSAFHCDFSYSTCFSFKLNIDSDDTSEMNTFIVSYSGDTRPKPAFAYIGQNSDLLIHESTLEDEKLKDAIDKKHSTTSEALQVGILMKAKKIILTHFSQRYKSFTCSESVYERLSNPKTKIDLINDGNIAPTPPSSPNSFRSYQTDLVSNTGLPLELRSMIFTDELNDELKENAAKIEILFAFDNMKVQYNEIHLQRKVFETEGKNLESLFSVDEDDNDIELIEEEPAPATGVKSSKKKEKKQQKQWEKEQNVKKRKMTPPPPSFPSN